MGAKFTIPIIFPPYILDRLWFFPIVTFEMCPQMGKFLPRKSFPARLATAKYFLLPDSSSVLTKGQKESKQKKSFWCRKCRTSIFLSHFDSSTFRLIIAFPPYCCFPQGPWWQQRGRKDNISFCVLPPIHLLGDGSFSVNVGSKRPIIITLYGSPNGPTRVQLAFSAKS